jgi:hypothetical protein
MAYYVRPPVNPGADYNKQQTELASQASKSDEYNAQIDAAKADLEIYKKEMYDAVLSGDKTQEEAAQSLDAYYKNTFQPAIKEPSYQLDLMTSDYHHWADWKDNNTIEGIVDNVLAPNRSDLSPSDAPETKWKKAAGVLDYHRSRLNSVAALDKANLLPSNIKKDFDAINGDFESAMKFNTKHEDWIKQNNLNMYYRWYNGSHNRIGSAALEWYKQNKVPTDVNGAASKVSTILNDVNNDYFKNYPTTLSSLFKTSIKDRPALRGTTKDQVGLLDGPILHQMVQAENKVIQSYEDTFKSAWGTNNWKYDSRLANYIQSGKTPNVTTSIVNNVPQFDINKKEGYDFLVSANNSNYDYTTSKFTPKPAKESSGINVFGQGGILRGGNVVDVIKDIGEVVLKTGFNIVTAPFEAPVALIEGIDDFIDGDKSLGTALWDMTKQTFGVKDIEDAVNNLKDGNYVDAYLNTAEFVADTQGGLGLNTDLTDPEQLANVTAESIADTVEKKDDGIVGDLKKTVDEDIIEPTLEATGILPPMEEEQPESKGYDMDTSNINTLKQLRELLGILPGDDSKGAIINALLGGERDEDEFFSKEPSVRKLGENTDIMRLMDQQRKVAKEGYDAGERETLSSKTRRELAARARMSGMAAGAAAGGLRGASVGAQARSLLEKGMQQQADVTTEMDKASIARKDEARKELAGLATGVGKFDIEQEEALKKRKGATTIGVQSLISQEELMKKQLELAAKG